MELLVEDVLVVVVLVVDELVVVVAVVLVVVLVAAPGQTPSKTGRTALKSLAPSLISWASAPNCTL